MTRARAAAKASEPATGKAARGSTTARAKSETPAAAPVGHKRTASKRKVRADESDDERGASDAEEDELSAKTRRPRGRPAKASHTEPSAASTTRTSRAKTTATNKPDESVEVAPKPRGRPKKVAHLEEPPRSAAGPASRATASTTSSRAGAKKQGPKKTVHFEEPDKENIDIAPPKTASASARGRVSRRGGASAAGTSRSTSAKKTVQATGDRKRPLSPKKVTQMPFSSRDKDSSEDELALDEIECEKPLKKAPLKQSAQKTRKDKDSAPPERQPEETDTTQEVNAAILHPTDDTPAFIASPARRPQGTPFKESLQSPAKKMPSFVLPGSAMKPHNAAPGDNPQTSHQDSLRSPAKKMPNFNLPGSAMKPHAAGHGEVSQTSPQKNTFLQSAAKRPASPIKGLMFSSPSKSSQQGSHSAMKSSLLKSPAKRAIPGFKPRVELLQQLSPNMKTILPATPTSARPSQKLMDAEEIDSLCESEDEADKSESLSFNGRLSAVLPRHADPVLEEAEEVEAVQIEDQREPAGFTADADDLEDEDAIDVEEDDQEHAQGDVEYSVMDIDDPAIVVEEHVKVVETYTPAASTNRVVYQLREKDLDPCNGMETDSEDELTMATGDMALSPIKGQRRISTMGGPRRSTLGFTGLVDQLETWTATSPAKEDQGGEESDADNTDIISADAVACTPKADSAFFEDEMVVRPDTVDFAEGDSEAKGEGVDIDEDAFGDVVITDEDVALQAEAQQMSEHQPTVIGQEHQSFTSDGLSEASQEYGDENEVPVDPALTTPCAPALGPVTPMRPPTQRTFYTTTKVPLKPEHTPSPLKQRSFSASRAAPPRPFVPTRNATVISFSPEKSGKNKVVGPEPTTSGTADEWSIAGTPARTPRKDLDVNLLGGAVVFVDVHTSEGADASGIFVDLLTCMGARCVRTWNWNPQSGDDTKIGITHVVYKDGGKRTMEKVRQTNGVVHCVGVSWVLE